MAKGVAITIGTVLLLFGLVFGLRSLGLIQYEFFAPKEEAARRTVFEESKSYFNSF